jgi:hypothetical protein
MVEVDIDEKQFVKLEAFIVLNDLDFSVDDFLNLIIDKSFDEWKSFVKLTC